MLNETIENELQCKSIGGLDPNGSNICQQEMEMASYSIQKLSNGKILAVIELIIFNEQFKNKDYSNLETNYVSVKTNKGDRTLHIFNPTITFKDTSGVEFGDLYGSIVRYYSYDFSFDYNKTDNLKELVSIEDITLFEQENTSYYRNYEISYQKAIKHILGLFREHISHSDYISVLKQVIRDEKLNILIK